MTANENESLAIQVAELRSDVRHMQADTTDIKADLRVTNLRFDRFDAKLESLREKTEQGFASLRKETGERIDSLRNEMSERIESIKKDTDGRFDKVDQRFEKVDQRFDKLEKRIDDVMGSLTSAKIWALGLYIGLAGSLFYVLARGFKWL